MKISPSPTMAVNVRRMVRRTDFICVKETGKREVTPAFVLQWLDKPEETGLLVGFTASKALGNAVQRNRARRRLKAAFDTVVRLNANAQGSGKWLVMVAKFQVLERDMAKIVAEMTTAMAAAGVRA